ncbi:MAG: magnesium and cobalt transport protein CorA [Actinomycetota bacterium]|nr:magnesium and cobalt transport protein CorA [Actinomycetota bacterium]
MTEAAARGLDDSIVDCAVYENGHRRSGVVPLEQVVETARSTGGFVWIGLHQPSTQQIATVAEQFALPPLAVEDAVMAHQRPKLHVYDDLIFVVLKPVRYVDSKKVVDVSEIAMFLGANFVVTVRHGDSDVLSRVRTELDGGSSELLDHGPSIVLYRTADLVVDDYDEAIDRINADVDDIEEKVFGSAETDYSKRIYTLKREIAEFRHAVLPLAAPVQRLADGSVPGIDQEVASYFRDVHDHVLRATDAIEAHDRLLSDVLQADLSRVSARQSEISLQQNEMSVQQNQDMRKISAWAAIALVPTAVAGIYGMNFDNMPELGWKYGYFMVLGLIATVCFGLHRLFHRNGWL